MEIKELSASLLCQILLGMCAFVKLLKMITKVPLAFSRAYIKLSNSRMLRSSTELCGCGHPPGYHLGNSCLSGEIRMYESVSLYHHHFHLGEGGSQQTPSGRTFHSTLSAKCISSPVICPWLSLLSSLWEIEGMYYLLLCVPLHWDLWRGVRSIVLKC